MTPSMFSHLKSPDLSSMLTGNTLDLRSTTRGPTQEAKSGTSVDLIQRYHDMLKEDPSLQSFTGLPYTVLELSLQSLPEQDIKVCEIVEAAALEDLAWTDAAAMDTENYRAHVLQQIKDIYDPRQDADPSWNVFFQYCLDGDGISTIESRAIPEAIFNDVEKKAQLPRVAQALRAHVQATRGMTDKEMDGMWCDPRYNERMRYLQRASQLLKTFCVYHMENTLGKFMQSVPEGWSAIKSA